MSNLPDYIEIMFVGDESLTPEQTDEFIAWLQLNRGNRVIVARESVECCPGCDKRNNARINLANDIGDVIEFILTCSLNKIISAFSAILEITEEVVWWDEIWKSEHAIDIIDLICDQDIARKCEITLRNIHYIPLLSYMKSRGFEFIYNVDNSILSDTCERLINYYKNSVVPMGCEIAELRDEIERLRAAARQ